MNALVSALAAFITFIGFYNFLPLDYITFEGERLFGATITTIQGSDTLSASRTTINTNFANLNADKLENTAYYSTTTHPLISSLPSLATVGTITSGTWSGSTIAATRGGTASTTLSAYQVLLGNGSSGITVPAGWGTSGQFLTSNGEGSAPSWTSSSVNLTLQYLWTGFHSFTSLFATNASSTNATTTKQWITGTPNALLATDATGLIYATSSPISSYAAAPYSTTTTATTQIYTESTSYITPFTPTTIVINYWLGGNCGSGSDCYSVGEASFTGTDITSNFYYVNEEQDGTWELNLDTNVNTSNPYAGDQSSNCSFEIDVTSVSTNTFTVGVTYDGGSTFNGCDGARYTARAYR